jgi:hypothetical protein
MESLGNLKRWPARAARSLKAPTPADSVFAERRRAFTIFSRNIEERSRNASASMRIRARSFGQPWAWPITVMMAAIVALIIIAMDLDLLRP